MNYKKIHQIYKKNSIKTIIKYLKNNNSNINNNNNNNNYE